MSEFVPNGVLEAIKARRLDPMNCAPARAAKDIDLLVQHIEALELVIAGQHAFKKKCEELLGERNLLRAQRDEARSEIRRLYRIYGGSTCTTISSRSGMLNHRKQRRRQ